MNSLFDNDLYYPNKRFRNDDYEEYLRTLIVISGKRRRKGMLFTAQQAADITLSNAKVSANGPVSTHSDVATSNPQIGNVLSWDGSNWTNASLQMPLTNEQAADILANNAKVSADGPVSTHSDVVTSNPQIGDVLSWDGSNWTNVLASSAQLLFCPASAQQAADILANNAKVSANGPVSTHSDVAITNPQVNQILAWNGTNWVNRNMIVS
jgi:hypothetical protein